MDPCGGSDLLSGCVFGAGPDCWVTGWAGYQTVTAKEESSTWILRCQAEHFREVGSGRALCSAELRPEALGGRGGAEPQLLPGSLEGLLLGGRRRDSQSQLLLSHASQPHRGQP